MTEQGPKLGRRALLQGAASSSLLLLTPLRGRAQPSLCDSGVPRPAIADRVGLELREAMRGKAGDSAFAYELTLKIDSLNAFLAADPPSAEVVDGFVDWEGRAVRAPIVAGRMTHFAACSDDATHKRFELELSFRDQAGRLITLRGEKRLAEARGYDPAADLSRMRFTLLDAGAELASGSAQTSCADTLLALQSLRVHGEKDEAERRAARNLYYDYLNRRCAGCYPELPKLVSGLEVLTQAQWRAVALAIRLMLPLPLPADGPSVAEVVDNLERFLQYADAETFGRLLTQLELLGAMSPFVSGHIPSLKRFIDRQVHAEGYSPVKNTLIDLHRVAVLGYYAHPKSYQRLGYTPLPTKPLHRTCLPVRARPSERIFDVAIVGSGVAGSLLAERLTRAGKSVVILEAGPYVPEMTIDNDELAWLARLEKGSGLQLANEREPLARSARTFPILQGHCVGGGGVINNAVCFQLPVHRLEQWRGLGFPVEPSALRSAYHAVAKELSIGPVSDATRALNPSLYFLENAFGAPRRPSITEPPESGFYECLVNLAPGQCLGCGQCNTGCPSERKQNALQVHLPAALSPDRDCELVPDAQVEEVRLARSVAGVPARVAGLTVRGKDGRFEVRARQYVLSAGAIHTTALLLRSPDVRARAPKLPLGERFSVHLVSPVIGLFEQLIHSRPTLQLTHYYIPPGERDGFVIENLYNPPGQSAVVMPGYGQTHFERMRSYKHAILVGAVVPTLPNGCVSLGAEGRPEIHVPLAENEMARLRRGLALTARAMLMGRGDSRPKQVIAGIGGGGFVMRDASGVERFERWLQRFDQVALSTGHPQGGSCLSDDPRISVVGGDYRLRGFDNLRVCDASLFPMSAGVNPQWTIMALAHDCGRVMNAETGGGDAS